MKILVTGAAGQLGRAMVRTFQRAHEVLPFSHQDLDITDLKAVRARVSAACPEVVINCAAYNDVDGAEEQQVTALEVNALAVLTLARAAADAGATFVHYSTDFVFDGTGSRPYTEEDAPNPQGVYASSKLLGEWFAREAERHYVLRVESLFGGDEAVAHGSFDRITDAIRSGRETRVFADRTVSPSHVDDVASATASILERAPACGVYHCVNGGMATWYEVAQEIARRLGREARMIQPITLAAVPLKARRPQFCALSNAKLVAAGVTMPSWQDALGRYLAARRSE